MPLPNVVIITPHDLGDFVGCCGTPVATPHIDGLARAGVRFAQHFSTGTVCSPSRGSINTGCYPHTHGLMGLVHRGWSLDVERCPHLAGPLAQAGYETHLFGFQHEHPDPMRLGYAHVHGPAHCHAEQAADALIDWMAAPNSHKAPFFASVGFSEVHRMGLQPAHFRREVYEPARPEDVAVPAWLPDIPEVRADLADFYGAIKHLDMQVGRMLTALDRSVLAENTIVIFTSDHGASFIHGKATLYDGGTRVPWIMRWPAGLPAGLVVEQLSSHVDIVPTLFGLLEWPVPRRIQGRDQSALARGQSGLPSDLVFTEKNYTNYYDPGRMVRTQRFKYIRKGLRTCVYDFQIPEIELNPADFRRNAGVLGFYSAHRCYEELYDLAKDPGELHNVIEEPPYAPELARLRSALDGHMRHTHDPFMALNNGIELPAETYEEWRMQRLGGA
jgi:arylsulfatase A-like enzyme